MHNRDPELDHSRKSIGQESHISNHLSKLVQKFQRISSSIHIETNAKNAKLFEINKGGSHFKDDPITHLRNLENRSEMNRAQVQLLSLRKPKRYAVNNHNKDEKHQTYMSIYKRLQGQQTKEKNDTEITSEDQFVQTNEKPPSGIKHFSQLRQHPRILQYTLERLRDKSGESRLQLKKEQSKLQLKSATKPTSLLEDSQYKEIIEEQLTHKLHPFQAPKVIVDNQMTKFYSKSSRGKLDVKIKQNARCAKFLQRQQRIVTRLQDNFISKQNMKKLKEKLNVIVNEMNKDDKNYSSSKLPKLPHTSRG